MELLALVKHDCPVCDQLLPALDARRACGSSRSPSRRRRPSRPAARARAASRSSTTSSRCRRASTPTRCPAVLLLDGGEERGRVEGLAARRAWRRSPREAGVALDARRAARAPARLRVAHARPRGRGAARRAARARARAASARATLTIGGLEDPFEALHDRGLTDGLPVVPPTPERVVAMLEHTSRDPQDVVGVVPPYDGEATVEKVAINAVMAGCPPEALPVVLAAVEAACASRVRAARPGRHDASRPARWSSSPARCAERVGMNAAATPRPGQPREPARSAARSSSSCATSAAASRGVEDRAAHGQMGKVGAVLRRAARRHRAVGGPRAGARRARGRDRRDAHGGRGAAAIVDQLAREPEGLCASLALALESVAHPEPAARLRRAAARRPRARPRLPRGGLVPRARRSSALFALTTSPGRRRSSAARAARPRASTRSGSPTRRCRCAKFAAPDRILLAYAGGDAGLFSMVFGGWAAGEIGSAPVTRSVEPWRD